MRQRRREGQPEEKDEVLQAAEAQNGKKSKLRQKRQELKPLKLLRQLTDHPDFALQLMVILLSLSADKLNMERRIGGMTTTIDKVRNITELVNNGMQSMKTVAGVPAHIRRILD